MADTGKTPSLAHSHIIRLQHNLNEKDAYKGPEWESHRRLLDSAYACTNGGSGDIRVLSEGIGMLSAFVVQHSIQSKEEHDTNCPVKLAITTDKNGAIVMPWDKKQSRIASALSIDLGGKKLNASGPVAIVVCLMLFLGAMKWMGSSLTETAKSAVRSQVRQAVIDIQSAESDVADNKER